MGKDIYPPRRDGRKGMPLIGCALMLTAFCILLAGIVYLLRYHPEESAPPDPPEPAASLPSTGLREKPPPPPPPRPGPPPPERPTAVPPPDALPLAPPPSFVPSPGDGQEQDPDGGENDGLFKVLVVNSGAEKAGSCDRCHGAIAARHKGGGHRSLLCRECHDRLEAHVGDGEKVADMPVRRSASGLCGPCHEAEKPPIPGTPQVSMHNHAVYMDAGVIYTDDVCFLCHEAHDPAR